MQESFDPDSAAAWQVRLYKKSIPKREKLRHLQRYLSPVEGRTCLDVGGESGVIPHLLRRNGGSWVSVDSRETSVASMRALLGEEQVYLIDGTELPFDDQTFDTIVVINYLERLREDALFLRECHRCLKPKGELIISVPHVKSFSMVRGLRNMLGLTNEKFGRVRPGYRLRDVYEVMKDGFDIVEQETYGGFFVEFFETWVQWGSGLAGEQSNQLDEKGHMVDQQELRRFAKACHLQSFFYPFQVLGSWLDALFPFTRDHQLVIKCRPRPWNRRKSVKLRDGRSIAEAAIQTKIGSAAELVKPLPGS